ncbi:hypothetical protein [Amycolatopsis decaplanina]|uniref:hypothetical protein n=1 Tax=Amycolatopsis decaplanina TaxID=208441 RepID=UPI0003479619|nr:hypothetical protein [Amycolatopsis decaplanina]
MALDLPAVHAAAAAQAERVTPGIDAMSAYLARSWGRCHRRPESVGCSSTAESASPPSTRE